MDKNDIAIKVVGVVATAAVAGISYIAAKALRRDKDDIITVKVVEAYSLKDHELAE